MESKTLRVLRAVRDGELSPERAEIAVRAALRSDEKARQEFIRELARVDDGIRASGVLQEVDLL